MENITVVPALRSSNNLLAKSPVVIRVYISGKIAKTLAMGIKVLPVNWDPLARRVLKSETNYALYNMKIRKEVSRLEAMFTRQSLLGVTLTKTIAKKIAEGNDPGQDFYKFCLDWIKEKYNNVETLRTYKSEISKLKIYKKEVSFGDIDLKFLTGYKRYMEDKLKNSSNTVWKSFKFINTMIRDAIKMKGIIDHNPFEEFDRGSYKNPVKLGIELEHCNLIESLYTREDIPIIVRRVAIKFLLMCYSGLRFEDAMAFDPDQHVIGNDRIFMRTQKANVVLNMKLYNRLSRIIESLRDSPLPKMSNKEFNKWLKVVSYLAGIGHMNITSHVGRHTFGGLLAEQKIPEEHAQKLLAHKDIRSTRVYYHIKAKNLDDAMDKMNSL